MKIKVRKISASFIISTCLLNLITYFIFAGKFVIYVATYEIQTHSFKT